MPNRLIKESVCTSENVDQLTAFQETFFYRLIVNCDDYGRMDARPQILASKLYPLKGIRMNQITDALRALTSAELITIYQVNGKPFLQMKTWDRHQQIRAHKSKYPSPDDSNGNQMISDDINCNQIISDDSKCPRNPIQSNPNPESNPNPNPTRTRARGSSSETEKRFNIFWEAYPRKEDKSAARKAFDKLNPDDTLLNAMILAIAKQKNSSQWQENSGQFIPYPSTWISKRRWEDEVKPAAPVKQIKTVVAQQYSQREISDDEMEEALNRMKAAAGWDTGG